MRLHRLIFADMSEGFIVRYVRTKRQATRLCSEWKRRHPLRSLLSSEPVHIPGVRATDKAAFVAWLNKHASAAPKKESPI